MSAIEPAGGFGIFPAAEHATSGDQSMDITQQQEMWDNFKRLLITGSVTVIIVLALMAAFLT